MTNTPDEPIAPSAITQAVTLMRIGALLSAASVVLTLATFGAFKDDIAGQLNSSNNTVTQDEIDTAVSVGISFVVFIGVVSVVLWLWMAWKNAEGRAWARAVASVLGGLNVVFTFFGFVGGQYVGLTLVLQTATLAIAVGALFLLWRPQSTDYYEVVTAHRTTVL